KGSYGSVYKARDLKTSEMVAIKVISLSEGEEGYEEIRGEIEMLQQCSHPNVVRYLGSYQGEEYLWVGALFTFTSILTTVRINYNKEKL
nr:serine/threonine-protein kinase dst1 [Tanacetum cinerariifolium]